MAYEISEAAELILKPMLSMEKEISLLKAKGIFPIDCTKRFPGEPASSLVRNTCKRAIDKRRQDEPITGKGTYDLLSEISHSMKKSVKLDPITEIISSFDLETSIMHFHSCFINKGDIVVLPNPCPGAVRIGALIAGARIHYVDLTKKNGYQIQHDSIPKNVLARAKIIWWSNPIGTAVEGIGRLKRLCQDNGIILASDERYWELYYDAPAESAISSNLKGTIAFQSQLPFSLLTGILSGWVAGDRRVIEKFKSYIESIGVRVPAFYVDTAIRTMEDVNLQDQLRADYKCKRNFLANALVKSGLDDCRPKYGPYLWQISGPGYAKKLLAPEIAVITDPGETLAQESDGKNPGAGFVRFSLFSTLEDIKTASQRIQNSQL